MHELSVYCSKCQHRTVVRVDLSSPATFRCSICNCELLSSIPLLGFVYILSNPSMPGLVKIGHTCRDVESRVVELSSGTGVPEPFKIEAIFDSSNPKVDEAKIHLLLNTVKRSKDREFFQISVFHAIEIVKSVFAKDPSLPGRVPPHISKENNLAYSFQCDACGQRFGSRYARDSSTICPHCFSRKFH